MEELGEGDEFRLFYFFVVIFGQSSVLSTYNKESVKIYTDLESYLGPV